MRGVRVLSRAIALFAANLLPTLPASAQDEKERSAVQQLCVETLTQAGSTCEACAECLCNSCAAPLAMCQGHPNATVARTCTDLVRCITRTGCTGAGCYEAATCRSAIDRAAATSANPTQACTAMPAEENACAAATAFVKCAATNCRICESCPSGAHAVPPSVGSEAREIFISLLLAAVVFPLGFVFLEKSWPSIPGRRILRHGFVGDVIWYAVQSMVSRLVAPVAVFFALLPAVWLSGMPPGDFFDGFGPAGRLPFALQVLVAFVVADFLLYWSHRSFHSHRLWPFHVVHHSSDDVDWLSGTRMHPVNEIAAQLMSATPVLLCGFHPLSLVLLGPFFAIWSVLIHANLRWSFGPLRFVIASPVFHRWHHTLREDGLDKNFSSYLPIWDVLFGTFYVPDRQPLSFGVDDPVPDGFLRQLLYPFLPSSWRERRAATEPVAAP